MLLAQFRVGDEIRHSVLIRLQRIGQSANGGVFARGSVEDNSGTLSFICFDRDTVELLKSVTGPTAIVIYGAIQADRYANDGSTQVVIRKVEWATPDDDLSHLLPYTPKDINQYKLYLEELIAGVEKDHLRALLQDLLSGKVYASFVQHTAAMRFHHAYVGGLLEHSVDVARLAKVMASEIGGLDVDLVVAGALLHDIGKIYELSQNIGFEYTDAGRMLGHVTLGTLMVDRCIARTAQFPQEDARHLLHIMLSHHGVVENGAPVACVTKESFVVHYADEINSILNQFSPAEGQEKSLWQYNKMLSRYIHVTP